MTDTRHENITEQRFEPANGHRNGFLKGLFGGALVGAAAGRSSLPTCTQPSATFDAK